MPVEHEIVRALHLRDAVDRKADHLVNGHEQIQQDQRHDHRVDDRRGNDDEKVGVPDVREKSGLQFAMPTQHFLFEHHAAAFHPDPQCGPALGDVGVHFRFQFARFFRVRIVDQRAHRDPPEPHGIMSPISHPRISHSEAEGRAPRLSGAGAVLACADSAGAVSADGLRLQRSGAGEAASFHRATRRRVGRPVWSIIGSKSK